MPKYDTDSEKILGILLIEGFSLMSYASIIEPYRAANALAKRTLYRWIHVSADGRPVRASNGATVPCDQSVRERLACEILFVIAAGDPATFRDTKTFALLRRLAIRGTILVGVSGGPFILARAGLLNEHRLTIHWDHRVAFTDTFPDLHVEPGLYVIDRKRMTCAGGIAGLDFVIELIEREQGHALARRISEWLIGAEPRAAEAPQRPSLRERYRLTDDRLLKVLSEMEATVEKPTSRERLARIAGVSVRQLERLFVRLLNRTLHRTYLEIRLKQADQLVLKTAMPLTEIALACGFQSSNHFSRAFGDYFQQPPRERRAAAAKSSVGQDHETLR